MLPKTLRGHAVGLHNSDQWKFDFEVRSLPWAVEQQAGVQLSRKLLQQRQPLHQLLDLLDAHPQSHQPV